MLERMWDVFVDWIVSLSLPMICFYFAICNNLFLNVSVHHATGLEKTGDFLLSPFQYLFAGKEAFLKEDGSWELIQKFTYNTNLLPKSIASIIALPASLAAGSAVKGLSLLTESARKHHNSLALYQASTNQKPNQDLYRQMGIPIGDLASAPFMVSQGYQRRPGDENHLHAAKTGLKDITQILNQSNIPWWIDCGTLLGAYRYGGVIPWDNDIDIALLLPDFENAKKALNRLDPQKYKVQDWSGRDFPNTFLKIYICETKDMIDIYFYEIHPQEKTCSYIFAMDKNIFFFDWWKIRERRFTKPISFAKLFPLKKALFDGIEVFVPNDPTAFLQRYYGENLAPARIYDKNTNRFEKDLTHPYWLNPYVH